MPAASSCPSPDSDEAGGLRDGAALLFRRSGASQSSWYLARPAHNVQTCFVPLLHVTPVHRHDTATTLSALRLFVKYERAHADASFSIETLRKLFEANAAPKGDGRLVAQALADYDQVVTPLLALLDNDEERSALEESDAAKVHIIATLKAMAGDAEIGEQVKARLDETPNWAR